MRSFVLSFLVVIAGCGGASGPVQGPFTGSSRRFYVSRLMLPQQRSDFAADLNGDGRVDNQFGNVVGAIAGQLADNQHVDEIIAADPAPMIVEIVSDDPSLREDDTVGVRWIGGSGAADQLGAVLHEGALKSNRVTTTPAHATLMVPLFADADPGALTLDHYQLDLAPDGEGGFVGLLDGGSAPADVVDELAPGLIQMVRNNAGPAFIYWFDTNRDGMITLDEIASSGLVRNLIAADVQVGVPANTAKSDLSIGVMFTLAPCGDAACTRPTPAVSCFDRVRNGDETDVDCGGSCGACAGGSACSVATDCITRACDSGRCRAPSCGDAIRDGYEIDIDCGPGCGKCVDGAHCHEDADCQSGHHCVVDVNGTSRCAPPA